VASIKRVGSWRDDTSWRSDLDELERWVRKRKLRTGKCFLYELDGLGAFKPESKHHWETCLEVKGKARSEGMVKVRDLSAETVASIQFNPDKVSPRVVYHALRDWLRWRLRDKTFKRTGAVREVYSGNPWKKTRAWVKAEVQVLVKKK